ncbi:MAG TPA: Tad domain-containing protein [Allosphingosinicella sp.]|uniref:Tad domain-containing protein n=1 Tax=Allosphingosinicella sp. TaxID=2823234 RepID=UPI002ED8C005
MRRTLGSLRENDGGAVAPTVALSLVALIAAGGIAFDYARMAGLDTELQNGADQSALAAATQLDGKAGACARASAAAVSFVANQTLLANDGGGVAITVESEPDCDAEGMIRFYQDKAKTTPADDDSNANFVEVTVNSRTAEFALTPIVSLLSSGDLRATAYAGLGSAICKVPPVMLCNPAEPIGNTNKAFPFDGNALRGVGLKLITGSASAPGNFGFLETGFGSGASNLAAALGYNTPSGDCMAVDGVTTKPGMNAVVMNALNTRFDLYTNGANTCPAGGTCSPSRNVRKDLVKGNSCGTTGGQGWQESANPYRPTVNAPLPSTITPDVMGHPRDICHSVSNDGVCGGKQIGDGVWDRDAYFRSNYGWNNAATWQSNTGLSANATRYEVYEWELENTTNIDTPKTIGSGGSARTAHGAPVCAPPGITPGGVNVDRRRISAAVLNCEAEGLNGSDPGVPVLKWIDLFLVEPSFPRKRGTTTVTEDKDVYVEVIGETSSGAAGSTVGQVTLRDVPYLIE